MNWIVMDLLSAVAIALSVCFAKKGGDDTDPTLSAAIFCSAVCGLEMFIGRKKFTLHSFIGIDRGDWFDILAVGILLGLSWLFLFMAFKSADPGRVFAMGKLYLVMIPVIEILINKSKFPVSVITAMVLFLFGIVMMLVSSESTEWMFNALIAASLYTTYHAIEEKVIEKGEFAVLLSHLIALFMFLLISLVKKNGETFKSLTFAHGCLLILAGFTFKTSTLLYNKALYFIDKANGSRLAVLRLNRLDVLFAFGLAALILKDKLSAQKIAGAVCVVLAIEALTL